MKFARNCISALLIASIVLGIWFQSFIASASPLQSVNHGIWAMEDMGGQDYSIHMSMYDANDTLPTGPLADSDEERIRSLWVTDPLGARVGDLDVEYQIITQAQNRLILEQTSGWIDQDEINAQDYGIPRTWMNSKGDYFFDITLPAPYSNAESCQDIFFRATYFFVPGGMQFEGHRRHLYEEAVKAMVFHELSMMSYDEMKDQFMERFGGEYEEYYQEMMDIDADFAYIAGHMAEAIEAHLFLSGNIDGLQAYGHGLEDFAEGMRIIDIGLQLNSFSQQLNRDAFEGLMMHAYSNGLAGERMAALSTFAHNHPGLDPTFVDAVDEFEIRFQKIVTDEFQAAVNNLMANAGEYFYSAVEIGKTLLLHGWGYFGVGLSLIIMTLDFLYGRDDIIRTIAIDLTLQDQIQEYLQDNIGSLPTREMLLLNNIKQYLSYHYYATQLDHEEIFTDFVSCWDPGIPTSQYLSYLWTERNNRLIAYQDYGPPDFLAHDISDWLATKIDTPSIVNVSPSGPLSVIKPDIVQFDIDANDDSGISRIDLFSGGAALGSDSNGADGWLIDWPTLSYPGGQHLIEVVVKDEHGLQGKAVVIVDLIDPGYASDLGVSNLDASLPTPEIGQQVDFSASVKNWGTYPESDAPVTLYIDELPVDTSLVTLNPAQETSVNFSWTATYGAHNVRVAAELPYDENPANDIDTLVLGAIEPGVLQVAGTSTPSTIRLNLAPGMTSDRYIILRNSGDIGLNVSVSSVPPTNGSITLLSTTPFFIPGNSFHTFNYRVGVAAGAPIGQDFNGSLTFTSPGGDVFQQITVSVVEVQAGLPPITLPMIPGWVDDDPDYYTDMIDLTPWLDLIPDGLDYDLLRFTADSVDSCPGGYCNFQTYILDGAWFPCSGSVLFDPADVPVDLSNSCGRIIGHSTRTFKIVALGGARFHIDPVAFEFRVYDGDPNLVLTRQVLPASININQTATVQLSFENIGTNEATDPLYNESPLPFNIELVSGLLSDEIGNMDPGDTDTASYTVRALQPGEYTFPSTVVNYYNATKSHAYEGSFDYSVLTVLGGTLQPVVTFDPAPYYFAQSQRIYAEVTDSLNAQTVSGASVVATVTTPSLQTHDVQLLYNAGLDQYVGDFHNTHELGAYSVHVVATGDYYTIGATSPDPAFTVVTPFGVDLSSAPLPSEVQPIAPSLLPFDIQNIGAGGDTFQLNVQTLPADWLWGVTPGIVTLNASQILAGAVTVSPLAASADGTYDVTLQAESQGDPAVSDSEVLTVSLDGTPPSVDLLSISPGSAAPGDTLNLNIDLDEAATLELDFSAFDSNWNPAGVNVIETDPVNHVYSASYQISSGTEIGDGHYAARLLATDAAGNTLEMNTDDVWLERHSPQLTGADPADEEDTPFGTKVRMHFSEPMDQSETSAVVTIDPPIEGTLAWADESTLVFAPNEYFLPGITYTVSINTGGSDVAGNPLTKVSWSFTILPIERSLTTAIGLGWNLVTLPFGPGTNLGTAEELCTSLSDSSAVPVEIARWYAGGWDSHLCGLPFNDFDLAYGEGYFARAGQGISWDLTGIPMQDTLHITLLPGWNLVGIPYGINYTAESAAQEIISQGGVCSEVDRWYAAGWDSHIVGLPFNNFDLEPGNGYFLRCDSSGTWSITP